MIYFNTQDIYKYISFDLLVKLRIGLENFKGVIARVWFIAIAILSLQLRSTGGHVTSPTRVSFLNDKGGKGERAWDRGWKEVVSDQ